MRRLAPLSNLFAAVHGTILLRCFTTLQRSGVRLAYIAKNFKCLLKILLIVQTIFMPVLGWSDWGPRGEGPIWEAQQAAAQSLDGEAGAIFQRLMARVDRLESGQRESIPDLFALNSQRVRWKHFGDTGNTWGSYSDLRMMDITVPNLAVPLDFPKFVNVGVTEDGYLEWQFRFQDRIYQQVFGGNEKAVGAHSIKPIAWAMDNEFLIVLEENGTLRQFDLSNARSNLLKPLPSFVVGQTKFTREVVEAMRLEGKMFQMAFVGRGGSGGFNLQNAHYNEKPDYRAPLSTQREILEESLFPLSNDGKEPAQDLRKNNVRQNFGDLEFIYTQESKPGERVQISLFSREPLEQINTFYLLVISNISRLLDKDFNGQVQRTKEFIFNFFRDELVKEGVAQSEASDFESKLKSGLEMNSETLMGLSDSTKKNFEANLHASAKDLERGRAHRSMSVEEELRYEQRVKPLKQFIEEKLSQMEGHRKTLLMDKFKEALLHRDLSGVESIQQELARTQRHPMKQILSQMMSSKSLRLLAALSAGGVGLSLGLPDTTHLAVSAVLGVLHEIAPVLFEPSFYWPMTVSFIISCLHLPILYILGALSPNPQGFVLSAGQKGILMMTRVWTAAFLPWWHRIAKLLDRELVVQAARHQVFDLKAALKEGSRDNLKMREVYNKLAQSRVNRRLLARALAMRYAAQNAGIEPGLIIEYIQKQSTQNWTPEELEKWIENPGFNKKVEILTDEFYQELAKLKDSLGYLSVDDLSSEEMDKINKLAADLAEKVSQRPRVRAWARAKYLRAKTASQSAAAFVAGLGYQPYVHLKNALVFPEGLKEAFRRYSIDYPLAVATFLAVGPKANPGNPGNMAVQLQNGVFYTNPAHLGEMYLHFFLHTGYGGAENSITFAQFRREKDETYDPQSNRSLDGTPEQGREGFWDAMKSHFSGFAKRDERPGQIIWTSFMNSMHMVVLFVSLDLAMRLLVADQAWAPAIAGVLYMQAMRIAGYNGPWVFYNMGASASRKRLSQAADEIRRARAELSQAVKADNADAIEKATAKLSRIYNEKSTESLNEQLRDFFVNTPKELNALVERVRSGDQSAFSSLSQAFEGMGQEAKVQTEVLYQLSQALDSGNLEQIQRAKEALVASYTGTGNDAEFQTLLRKYTAIGLLEFSVRSPPVAYKQNEAALNTLVFAVYGMGTTLMHSAIHVLTGGSSIAAMSALDLTLFVGQGVLWATVFFSAMRLLDKHFYEKRERKAVSDQFSVRFSRPLAAFHWKNWRKKMKSNEKNSSKACSSIFGATGS